MVITPGAKPIMFFAMLALIDEGDEVIYPNPGFPIYESMINFVGGIPVPMKLLASNNFEIDLNDIVDQISPKTKLMIINSPNNPCGSVISKEDLTTLANLAKKNDFTILTDEVYRRFLYEGEYFSPVSVPGMTERTIILDGFSKTYSMTGWRAGFGVMPENLVEPISRLSTNSVSCTASFTQIATLEAMNGPQEEPMRMVDEFKKRRDVIVNGLNSIPGIECPMPGGAFYVFPSIEGTGMSSKQFANDLLEKHGVACLAGESFGEYGKGCIRFSFANSMENLNEALDRINSFVIANS